MDIPQPDAMSEPVIEITVPRERATLTIGGPITGYGWIVSATPIVEASIFVGSTLVCGAATDLSRPDVHADYPAHPRSLHSGFEFGGILRSREVGENQLELRLRFANGRTFRRYQPVLLVAGPPHPQPIVEPPLADQAVLTLYIDSATLSRRGVLTVRGWAAGYAPIATVEVMSGDTVLGRVAEGYPRPDVATSHPDYANVANSGFLFRCILDDAAIALGTVTVVAYALGGITRRTSLPFELPKSIIRRSPTDAAIHSYCDTVYLREDGGIALNGWATGAAGIARVAVHLDGRPLGNARLGLSRADVGNTYPEIPDSRNSGFSFDHRTGTPISGEHVIELIIHPAEGGAKEIILPVLAVPPPIDTAEPTATSDGTETIKFFIDLPATRNGVAIDPVKGALSLAGWAVAKSGIADIEVFIGDTSLGMAHSGIGRRDVAAAFPDWKGSLFPGFAMTLPHRALPLGRQPVRIVIRDHDGGRVETGFDILVEESTIEPGTDLLRTRIGQAEIDLKCGLVAASRLRPAFTVALRLMSDGEPEIALAQTTLATLRRQCWADWTPLLLLPDLPIEPTQAIAASLGIPNAIPCTGPATIATLLEPWHATGHRAYFIALQAGDRLSIDSLLEFALQAAMQPEAGLIYADERRHDGASGKIAPFYKPDWSPDLALSTNYIGRPWCADAATLAAAGATLADLATYGEYDLVLRLTETADVIAHLPLILAERGRRTIDTPSQERRALHRALRRRRIKAAVSPGCIPGVYRVKRHVPDHGPGLPMVSIIIPTIAARGLIKTTIDTIRALSLYRKFEIIALDNIPADNPEWKSWLATNADRVLPTPGKFNWSRFNNRAAAAAKGDYLLFLNDDIEILDPAWLHALLEHASQPGVGAVGPQLLYPDRKVQHAGLFLADGKGRHAFRFHAETDPGPFGLARTQRNVIAVTGACLMTSRRTFETLGGFDEAHSVVNNDLDYCLRVWRSGRRVVFTPHTSLIHHELASRAKLDDVFNAARFTDEWATRFHRGDPFFHPALCRDDDNYQPDPEPVRIVAAGHPILARSRVRRILAQKLDHIGDFVTALPALRRIRQLFPDAELHVLAPKASVLLARLEPAITSVIEFNYFNAISGKGRRRLTKADFAALEDRLRPYQFDIAIDLRKHPDTRPLLKHANAGLLAGFSHRNEQTWLDVALEWEGDPSFLPKRNHIADDLLNLVQAVSNACDTDRSVMTDLLPRAHAIAAIAALPALADIAPQLFARPVVCIHPASGSVMRQWPASHFAALIDLLVEHSRVHVIIIGTASEAPLTQNLLRTVRHLDKVWPLTGKIGMADLPTLLRASVLYVGNNSGPKHIAAAFGVPTVGIHSGVVDAREWGPIGPYAVAVQRNMTCGPCYLVSPDQCHRGLACLQGVRPADVFRVCRQMMLGAAHLQVE